MIYQGSCHCGRIAFEVEAELTEAWTCNCSICSRKGSLLWFVPRDSLRLSTPNVALGTYTFYKHAMKHRFCPNCGIHSFCEGADGTIGINVGCLQGVNYTSFTVQSYDGRST